MTHRYPFPGAEHDALALEPGIVWTGAHNDEARMNAVSIRAPEARSASTIHVLEPSRKPIRSLISAIVPPRNHLVLQGFRALLNVNVC